MLTTEVELFEALSNGAVLITPNARLTKIYSERYDAAQQQPVWPRANILPFSQWIKQLWCIYASTLGEAQPTLLTDQQSDLIWLTLVSEHESSFYNAQALAKKLKQAYEHCLSWQLEPLTDLFDKNEETLFFKKLLQGYLQATENKISSIELLSALLEPLERAQLVLPKQCIFAFFDDFTPLQTAFIEQLKQQEAMSVDYFDERANVKQCFRVDVDTAQDELTQVIIWIKQQLAQRKKNIGIVVPNLQQLRDPFEKTLLMHFKKQAFNISMGKPLIQYPIVNNALALLSLTKGSISLDQLHLLCHSTFIGKCKEEKLKGQRLYEKLQRSGESRFYLSVLSQQSLQGSWLGEAIGCFIKIITRNHKQNLPQWRDVFLEALEAIGFPGDRSLSSEEYQIHIRFLHALNEFGQLADMSTLYDKSQAMALLRWLLDGLIFQPKAHESSVQFIGFLEALGLQFDALWIMDVHENQFPKKLNPSAFIPIETQRELHMPHASDERELRLAKTHIQRLSQSGQEVIFSHYKNQEGIHLHECALISHLPYERLPELPQNETKSHHFEKVEQCQHAPLLPVKKMRGGSYLIKEQAQCPFRAFSKFRLSLQERRENMEGLDPLDRGVLIHKVMELFWRQVQTQEVLLQLEEDGKLEVVCYEVIKQALTELKREKPHTCTPSFLKIESQRLGRILNSYLALEKTRPPFKVIHIEFEGEFVLEGVPLKLRIDRIDELENGDWLVIDYKTGLPSVSGLFETRLTEPQLPMYVLMDDNIKAIVYGQLQQKAIRNKGVSQEDVEIEGITTIEKNQSVSWQEQKQKWQVAVTDLMQEFLDGQIATTPSSEIVCVSCQYKTLCGLNR